ncbi:tripartite tricarboxylate transporter substrate binding protein [Roseococcus sp. SDR]|uniref:Bug family tripartite tricarboxylate transporter substrate binding protein n=1 Tax=Roseococcus sp. SDR TaxID=2835532 RepID=UPI001BCC4040|nr:tripartite tricarboxylate transporter substrate binding protein [Roseococcus sp. SDR]MBS7789780.1 tripartite tricarboxylate transporter substrate binding protein [Roseococcus sp. SDR]MBV1845094.1 tripartite tricarboxylate transporter substrate binding protein [Roseococcus sp. SDR]
MHRRALTLAAPMLALTGGLARAQAWPNRPVRFVVGFAAGGANDIVARLLAAKLAERIPGSSFIVENRPGASTVVAADLVARSAPDGTTFFYTSPSTQIAILVNRTATIDPMTALVPVVMAQSAPLALVSRPDFPARTVPEFLALARERGARLTISNPGTGAVNHLAMALLMRRTGIEPTLVPYSGNQPSITALIRGEVDLAHDGLFTPRAQLQEGTLRAIAVTTAQRSPLYPDVPAFAETLPGYDVGFWGGLLAPRGTPDPILDRLAEEVGAILAQPDVITRIRGFGAEPASGGRAAFARVYAADWEKWGQVVRENDIRPG